MSRRLDTIWPLEPHTAAKHAILKRYLQAWFPILGRDHGRVVFVDAFAGPGEYSHGEPGSPMIALQTAVDQQAHLPGEVTFLFIEKDAARLENLNQQIGTVDRPTRFVVEPRLGECAPVVNELLDAREAGQEAIVPTFAFLDPFGFSHTPMALIKRLMAHRRCEVLITFMFEEINRFLAQEQQPEHFDALFGTDRWREALAQPTPELRRALLKQLYQNRLKDMAGIRHVMAFEMRNQANTLDYILYFGTNSTDGLKKMKEAMWKVDPAAGFSFSDATDANQSVLFTAEPDWRDVKRRIVARFSGQEVLVDKVERFIIEETAYRETHYKGVLKQMEYANPPELIVEDLGKRRRGTFPSGTTIRFMTDVAS